MTVPYHWPLALKLLSALLALAIAAVVLVAAVTAAPVAKAPPWVKNCTALNKKYPHGIGKAKARDKTSDTPVTTFKRSTKLYKLALSHNGRLDGDGDGVACESD
jgi:hypothetical protein